MISSNDSDMRFDRGSGNELIFQKGGTSNNSAEIKISKSRQSHLTPHSRHFGVQ